MVVEVQRVLRASPELVETRPAPVAGLQVWSYPRMAVTVARCHLLLALVLWVAKRAAVAGEASMLLAAVVGQAAVVAVAARGLGGWSPAWAGFRAAHRFRSAGPVAAGVRGH